MRALVRRQAELVARHAPMGEVGGEALGLVQLAGLDCPVPPFFVLTTAAWEASGGGETPPERLAPEVGEAIAKALAELGPGPYAVRSSAVKDAVQAARAGQLASVLGVAANGVSDAVRACWASGAGERVHAEARGPRSGAMAVVVQRMVLGQASGVASSRTPEDPERAVLSVGLGLGEGVVRGLVPCDAFRVDRRGRVEAEIAKKDEESVLVDGEVRTRPVEGARRDEPALSEGLARDLAVWCFRLEAEVGRPVDVEFTVDRGHAWFVRARPVTVLVPHGHPLVWDSSTIVESYSGITTPLTFSFASSACTIIGPLFCRAMGVDAATIRGNEPAFRQMIGLVRGRVCYNLDAWYRVLSLLPGFQLIRAAVETTMGLSEVAPDEDAGARLAGWRAGLRRARLGGRLTWRLLRLERDAARFQEVVEDTLRQFRTVDLDRLEAADLLSLYEDIEQKLLWAWTPPLVNDLFCTIFYEVLERRCRELTGDPATTLHNRLVAGEGSLASTAPALDLLDLARRVRDVDALRVVLGSDRPEDEVIAEAMGFELFRDRWRAWMDRYGDCSPDELKLEAPSLRDTPSFVLDTVRAWMCDDASVRDFGAAPRGDRDAAEAEARRRVGPAGDPRAWARRRVFEWVLHQARRCIAMRESLRMDRTRIFGLVRLLFRAFGDRYAEAGHLDARDDVFWLTVDEVLGFTRGTTASTDLRGLVSVRRAEFERYRVLPAPAERFHTWGAVHLGNVFAGSRERPVPPAGDEIAGTPCAPGRVVAPVRVVRDPREVPDLGGAILVAHHTDPGWVSLFPTASAVVVEGGSPLSHAAVVAREIGLPAVVGVRGLLGWVREGETLGVDGSAGRVWRVHEDEADG